MRSAQVHVEYAFLLAVLALATLLGGRLFGHMLMDWFEHMLQAITSLP